MVVDKLKWRKFKMIKFVLSCTLVGSLVVSIVFIICYFMFISNIVFIVCLIVGLLFLITAIGALICMPFIESKDILIESKMPGREDWHEM